jgi:peptide/nickel transport system permease protein
VATYIIRRLIQVVIILLLVTIIVFLTMHLLPGDPIMLYATQQQTEGLTQQQLDIIRHEFGLDKPLPEQYISWIANVFKGDLGISLVNKNNVAGEVGRRLPITIHIGLLAFVIGIVIGLPVGIISAVRRGTLIDTTVTVLANIGITIPTFWLGIMLVYLFALYLGWLPSYGYTSPFEDFWKSTRQIIMPVFCLAIFPIASTARQTRSSMLEVMQQDYIRTAWSKGLEEKFVILKHALKNSLIPVITLTGMGISGIFGGSVLIENVFSIPGMGRLAVFSIFNQDYPFVQAITLIMAVIIVFSNLLVDISYGWLDPRIRYR